MAIIEVLSQNNNAVDQAISQLNHGDILYFPEGRYVLTTKKTIEKNISIIGDNAIIVGDTSLSYNALITLRINNYNSEISGLSFENKDLTDISSGMLSLYGNTQNFRIHHCKFNQGGAYSLYIRGVSYGLIDHCDFINDSTVSIDIYGLDLDSATDKGDTAWLEKKPLGIQDAVFIENCNFINTIGDRGGSAVATNMGSRYVFRNNRVSTKRNYTLFDAHGSRIGYRGSYSVEIYDNIFEATRSYYGGYLRGGRGVIFNNKFIGDFEFPICLAEYACFEDNPNASYPAKDQINNYYIWNNYYNDRLITDGYPRELVQNRGTEKECIKNGRDYFMVSIEYKKFNYPHPLQNIEFVKNKNIYEIENNETKIYIGGKEEIKLIPNLNLSKWDDDAFLNINYPDIISNEIEYFEENKIIIPKDDKNFIFYKDKINTEFKIEFKENLISNRIEFDLTSRNLKFFKQSNLNKDEQLERHITRSDNICNSYAIFHIKNFNKNKFCHIYRPKITDSTGFWSWCDMEIIENKLIIIIDQLWLDNAIYPIILDPTFGHTGSGASTQGLGNSYISCISSGNSTASGTVTDLNFQIGAWCSGNVKMGLYSGSTPKNLIGTEQTVAISNASGNTTWIQTTYTASIYSSITYWLSVSPEDNYTVGFQFDEAASIWQAEHVYANAWESTISVAENALYGVFAAYANYTVSSSGGGTTYICIGGSEIRIDASELVNNIIKILIGIENKIDNSFIGNLIKKILSGIEITTDTSFIARLIQKIISGIEFHYSIAEKSYLTKILRSGSEISFDVSNIINIIKKILGRNEIVLTTNNKINAIKKILAGSEIKINNSNKIIASIKALGGIEFSFDINSILNLVKLIQCGSEISFDISGIEFLTKKLKGTISSKLDSSFIARLLQIIRSGSEISIDVGGGFQTTLKTLTAGVEITSNTNSYLYRILNIISGIEFNFDTSGKANSIISLKSGSELNFDISALLYLIQIIKGNSEITLDISATFESSIINILKKFGNITFNDKTKNTIILKIKEYGDINL